MNELIFLLVTIPVCVFCIWCYRQGIKDGQSIKKDEPIKKVVDMSKPTKLTDEEIAIQKATDSIANYSEEVFDKTSKGR